MSVATVSATGVQDPTTQLLANGSWQLVFKPAYGVPGIPTDNGSTTFTKIFGGTLDNTASFSQANVVRNDTCTPAGSRWTLIIIPNATNSGYQVDLNVNSATFDCTSAINAVITAIMVGASPIARAYKDSEVIIPSSAFPSGFMYFDVTNKLLKIFDYTTQTWITSTVNNFAAQAHKFLTGYNAGTFTNAQPAASDLSDGLTGSGTVVMSTGAVISPKNVDGIRYADQYASFQACIDDTPSSGGVIILPVGNYPINTKPTLKSNLTIIGQGRGDTTGSPATCITTTITSGHLFDLTGLAHVNFEGFSIKNTAAAGSDSAFFLSSTQLCRFNNLWIAGNFAKGIQFKSSSTATASTIWNDLRDIHITSLATNAIGVLFDSSDAVARVINSNYLWNVACIGGSGGAGLKFTNSNNAQVINENVIVSGEISCLDSTGTGFLVTQGATRGVVLIDCNIEANNTGFNKATANTVTFIGGNISTNGTNVTDAQPGFTTFLNTNVGGVVQTFAVTPAGGIYADGIGIGGSAPVSNTIGGATGWGINASGNTVAFVNSTSLELNSNKNLVMDTGSKITSYNGVATVGNGAVVSFGQDDKTGQSASIGATTLITGTATTGGHYDLNAILYCTATDASGATVSVTFNWTSEGIARSATSSTIGVNATSQQVVSTVPVNVDNSTNITYSTTVTGAPTTGRYAVHVSVSKM